MATKNENNETTDWFIRSFPEKTKNEFMGLCKMAGKNWKIVLAQMIGIYNKDAKKNVGR